MLTGAQILAEVHAGRIKIDPFDRARINPNSYNMRVGKQLRVYTEFPLDTRKDNPTRAFDIEESGHILEPGTLYLAATIETTDVQHHIPVLNGRSTGARLGLAIHQTGGFGDIGFYGTWTLEMSVIHPLRIYPGDELCQIQFDRPEGEVSFTYRDTGRYAGESGPVASRGIDKRRPR